MSARTAAIDVLVTVYNGERFIAQTLDSVINQTFTDWRLIVVDDLSTDRTAEIVRGYAQRDSRILLVAGEHKGIAAAANVGLGYVTAPLVARLDGDDIAMPNRLQVQYDYLQQHPDVLAVGSDVMLIDEHNKPLRRRKAPTGWENIREILKTRNCMCHPSATIRTEALRRIGGYRDKFRNSLDYDLWLRVSEIGKIENIPQDLLLYRRHSSQVSASGNAHRQTLYSVGAVTDYFLRRYKIASVETVVDESRPDEVALSLLRLYEVVQSEEDLNCLNRHMIRFLHHVRGMSPGLKCKIYKILNPHLSVKQKVKLNFYKFINGVKNFSWT